MSHVASLPGVMSVVDPLVLLTLFHCLAGTAARALGADPATLSRLKKVTETV